MWKTKLYKTGNLLVTIYYGEEGIRLSILDDEFQQITRSRMSFVPTSDLSIKKLPHGFTARFIQDFQLFEQDVEVINGKIMYGDKILIR